MVLILDAVYLKPKISILSVITQGLLTEPRVGTKNIFNFISVPLWTARSR